MVHTIIGRLPAKVYICFQTKNYQTIFCQILDNPFLVFTKDLLLLSKMVNFVKSGHTADLVTLLIVLVKWRRIFLFNRVQLFHILTSKRVIIRLLREMQDCFPLFLPRLYSPRYCSGLNTIATFLKLCSPRYCSELNTKQTYKALQSKTGILQGIEHYTFVGNCGIPLSLYPVFDTNKGQPETQMFIDIFSSQIYSILSFILFNQFMPRAGVVSGSVGRAVTYDTRDLQFESSH